MQKIKTRMLDRKQINIIDWTIFGILLAVYTALTGYLFYHQAIGNLHWYPSDISYYLQEMQGIENNVNFTYPIFFWLGTFFNLFLPPEWAIVAALTLLNSASVVILKYYINKQFKDSEESIRWKCPVLFWKIILSVLTVTLFLVSMLFPVLLNSLPGIVARYLGVFTPNPFHNATYLAVRPFAIVCFFKFVDLLDSYEKNFSWKKGIAFSILLLLTTMTKPTFTLLLVSTAGLIMLFRLVRSRFANLKSTIFLGICFIPTFCDLLYQFFGMFDNTAEKGSNMAFGWLTAWKMYCNNIPLAILLAWAFPIVVFLINHKEIKKNKAYRFSLQLALVSLIIVMFFYETGKRRAHMNFSWIYMHGMFFAFVMSAIVLIKSTLQKDKKWYLLGLEWLFYFWHLGCGLLYFRQLLLGLPYG